MSARKLVLREHARQDIWEITDHYTLTAGIEVAYGFSDALQAALDHVRRNPGTGSPRYSHLLRIEGLRSWPVRRFPYIVLYADRPERLEVWRIIHSARQITEIVSDPDEI